MSPKLTYSERYDWRLGVEPAKGLPRAFQPRRNGPPLLFATDIRMTILVTLALAEYPIRCRDLWRAIGRRNFGCLADLARRGLAAKWKSGRHAYVALEPAHPAADSLRRLLLRVATVYGFSRPVVQLPLWPEVGAPRRRARIDARHTLGDCNQTLSLLVVYVRGCANSDQVVRSIPRSNVKTIRHTLLKFCAFGVLDAARAGRGIAYSLNREHILAREVRRVLGDLDRSMPQWRVVAENDMLYPRARSRESRVGRRKPGRWRW
jgi:hypothetical protein